MTSRLLAAVVVVVAVLGTAASAYAEKKRVVVVLDFEGPKADRFHDELVKLIKKTHTVLSTDRWNGAAEEMGVGATTSDKDIKRIARKLKVDAVVEGRIEKRRDEFIIRLKLHDGKSGSVIGSPIDTKAGSAKLEGKAQQDIKDELVDAIGNVEPNGGGDDEDVKPRRHKRDDDAPADDGGDAPKKFSKHPDAERGSDKVKEPAKTDDDSAARKRKPDDDVAAKPRDDDPPRKAKHKTADDGDGDQPKKKVAAKDDDAATAEVDVEPGDKLGGDLALSPGERALDAVLGISFTARSLTFTTKGAMLSSKPLNYNGVLVAGGMLDATFYPLAFGHDNHSLLKDLGINVMFDRVFKIDSRDGTGNVFATTEQRLALNAVFRHAFGHSVTAPVAFARFGYSNQSFAIAGTEIPSVSYMIFEPGAGVQYPITPKVIAGIDGGAMLIPKAGGIQGSNQYGASKVLGFEGEASVDLLVTRNIFARVAVRVESIGFKFTGDTAKSNGLDMDPTTVDVPAARDTYLGGFATVGYLY